MPKLRPCKRRDFIRKLKKIGFKAPEPGLPSNKEYSVPQVKMLIKEIERGIHQKIPLDEWESL